jgi:hypothetical protein
VKFHLRRQAAQPRRRLLPQRRRLLDDAAASLDAAITSLDDAASSLNDTAASLDAAEEWSGYLVQLYLCQSSALSCLFKNSDSLFTLNT